MVQFDTSTGTTDSNATAVLYAFLRRLKAKVTWTTLREELPMHPDFPSLLSLSEIMTGWKIDNTALQLNTVEQLRELPIPFIAHLRRNNGWYVLVTALQGNTITYIDGVAGRRVESVTDFEKQWSGVVLLAEADEQSGEPHYEASRRQEFLEKLRGLFLLSGVLLLFLLFIINAASSFTLFDWLLLITKTTGLVLSGLLVAKQSGYKNALTDRFCQINSKTNCDDVLNSSAAKLWGWLSWSDVGLVYFAGGLLTVLLMSSLPSSVNMMPTIRSVLYALTLLVVPYTIFSVYYQARIAGQWCTICLIVQILLLTECIIALRQPLVMPTAWQSYATIATTFLLPALTLMVLKPLLVNQQKVQRNHNELMRFRRDPDLFRALLEKQPQMPPVLPDMHPIMIGNPEAEHIITMVTNSYCEPCAKTHTEIEQLILANTSVKLNIIFACGLSESKVRNVSKRLLALSRSSNSRASLVDWYNTGRLKTDTWMRANPSPINTDWPDKAADKHSIWCRSAEIVRTPTLFVNGYLLNGTYHINELRWLINYLPAAALKKDLARS